MSGESERPEVIARGDGVLGEIALRRRGGAANVVGDSERASGRCPRGGAANVVGDSERASGRCPRGGAANVVGDSGRASGRCPRGDVYELIVNGVFLMDTAETSSEVLLAESVLDRHASPRRILVGGLGLGFTTAALLRDRRVERIDVVEIEPLLVDWLRAGLVPGARAVVNERRVDVQVTAVLDALAVAGPVYDAILLDVDNGPDFLVSDRNASLYEPPALAAAAAALTPSGLLAVWSSHRSPPLRDALATVCENCAETPVEIVRDGRPFTYFLYAATRRSTVI